MEAVPRQSTGEIASVTVAELIVEPNLAPHGRPRETIELPGSVSPVELVEVPHTVVLTKRRCCGTTQLLPLARNGAATIEVDRTAHHVTPPLRAHHVVPLSVTTRRIGREVATTAIELSPLVTTMFGGRAALLIAATAVAFLLRGEHTSRLASTLFALTLLARSSCLLVSPLSLLIAGTASKIPLPIAPARRRLWRTTGAGVGSSPRRRAVPCHIASAVHSVSIASSDVARWTRPLGRTGLLWWPTLRRADLLWTLTLRRTGLLWSLTLRRTDLLWSPTLRRTSLLWSLTLRRTGLLWSRST
ncbi:MAG: hypothetical protein DWQ46_03475 [Planctomycetota bacterium]|nr:MAG: hypothetical protein DWQ46_03475 [Planctomycetota bacterium]